MFGCASRRGVAAIALALATSLVTDARAARPGYRGDLPDPFVYRDGATYLAIGTNTASVNVPLLASTDLQVWKLAGDAMPQLPSWVKPGLTWAPSVLGRKDTWVLYYTARDRKSDLQAIGCAVATSPRGPFVDEASGPLISTPEEGGAIDASPFVDDDGRAYLLWKGDGNAIGVQTHLYIQELSEDGRKLKGRKSSLLVRDREWEKPLVEGPSLIKRGGVYHLFYSAGWWESEGYGVGHAVASRLRGPYRKTTLEAPALASHGSQRGTGGQEFFDGPGGLWVAYHAWTAPRIGYAAGGKRRLHVAPLSWDGEVPRFGNPSQNGKK